MGTGVGAIASLPVGAALDDGAELGGVSGSLVVSEAEPVGTGVLTSGGSVGTVGGEIVEAPVGGMDVPVVEIGSPVACVCEAFDVSGLEAVDAAGVACVEEADSWFAAIVADASCEPSVQARQDRIVAVEPKCFKFIGSPSKRLGTVLKRDLRNSR